MNSPITRSGSVRSLGTMSGTSLDGIDAAILETDGHQIFRFGKKRYRPYNADERRILRAGLDHWQGAAVIQAENVVNRAHAELLAEFHDFELVGFHGQTLAHEPRGRGTLQAGDGKALADSVGTPVVWDFRSEDIVWGGEGAPLAPFFHFACSKWIGVTKPVCFLNLGGVGNVTYVNPQCDRPERDEALLAFDTGPANALIDDLMQIRQGLTMDKHGCLAKTGKVNTDIVDAFGKHPYFDRKPPKSLDRNDFPEILELVLRETDADAAATLTALSVASIVRGLEHLPSLVSHILVTGGGRKNSELMRKLRESCSFPIDSVESVGLDGDMLEAQAFAYLAVRVMKGLATSGPSTTGVSVPVSGGIVSRP